MSDFLPLFDAPQAEDDPTWTVLRLNQAIDTALKSGFPGEIWVRGEIQGLGRTRMRKHWYFELVEKEPGGDGVRAKLPVALLAWNRSGVDRTIASTPGFSLDDNIEVRICGRVSYYPPFGKLQLEMTGVDPAFTLGQLAANRERILRELRKEKLLDRNAGRPLPVVPARIGLVTSIGSAAYNDFVHELQNSGLGLRVEAIDARVQGPETESSIVAALRSFARRRPDVVVLIRGGGSQSDLAGFDSEAIARAIAAMPVPVFTGIGHEIDVSVADHVAHTRFKTPTACAAHLVDMTRDYVDGMEDAWERVSGRSRVLLKEQNLRLAQLARDSARSGRTLLATAHRDVAEQRRRLRLQAPRSLQRQAARLDRARGEIRAAGRVRLADARSGLRRISAALSPTRLAQLLDRERQRLHTVGARLGRSSMRHPARQNEALTALEARVRALDPRRVLARGYSLTRDESGKLLRSVKDAKKGQGVVSVLVDGEIHSVVDSTNENPQGEEA